MTEEEFVNAMVKDTIAKSNCAFASAFATLLVDGELTREKDESTH